MTEQYAEVTDVRMMDQKPADQLMIDAWEKVILPITFFHFALFSMITYYSLCQW